MKILAEYGREDVARVYVASMKDDGKHLIEFVESLQPPIPREKKWVLIVSSSFGCPMECLMCDAGGSYLGRLETSEILAQVDHMVSRRFPNMKVPVEKFKVQFARMGEPSYNDCVLEALAQMPQRYAAPGLMACISTVAPATSSRFFSRLVDVKNEYYSDGRFQLQFSIHTTDEKKRDWLIPGRKWRFSDISRFGEKFHSDGDRKLALNFALMKGLPVDPEVIGHSFDPERFVVKFTPLNPTVRAVQNGLATALNPLDSGSVKGMLERFSRLGFETILSVGEPEENRIGSNCGQYVSLIESSGVAVKDGYDTPNYRLS